MLAVLAECAVGPFERREQLQGRRAVLECVATEAAVRHDSCQLRTYFEETRE